MIALELTKQDQDFIDCLIRHLGKERVYAAIEAFFGRRAQATASRLTRAAFRGPLKIRTGSLARSIAGMAERIQGLPALRVGIFRGPALRYAGVQEFGTRGKNPDSPIPTIRPKKAKALAIPEGKALTPAGVPRFTSPREYPEKLRFIPFRRGIAVGALYEEDDVERAMQKGVLDLDSIKRVYLLLRRVDIEPKRFLSDPFKKEVVTLAIDLLDFLHRLLAECGGEAA